MTRPTALDRMHAAAADAASAAFEAGARNYDRALALPRLLRRWAQEFGEQEPAATLLILAALEAARCRERSLAGRWGYDLDRHIALGQAIAAERRRLAPMQTPPEDSGGATSPKQLS